jgi:hypothetical protein
MQQKFDDNVFVRDRFVACRHEIGTNKYTSLNISIILIMEPIYGKIGP